MRSLARISLGMLGLALIVPAGVEAQNAPTSFPSGYYQPAAAAASTPAPAAVSASAPAAAPTRVGADGKPMTAPAPELQHKHWGRTPCPACVAKMQAANPGMAGKIVACEHWKGGNTDTFCAKCRAKFATNTAMVPGKIVGCEHSKNGVCSACQAALNAPGQFIMPGEAPGRAVASSSPAPSGQPVQAAMYDSGMGEPAPVGVVQANFSQQAAPTGAPAAANAPQAMPPGRAVAQSSNFGNDPYQAKSGPFPHPHILGHLFGWSGLGAEKKEEKAWKKAEAHASIAYDENGNSNSAPVTELPASTVFGKKR
jgi:hypothetical protein